MNSEQKVDSGTSCQTIGNNLVSGSAVSEALSELLKVAASLLRVQPSEYYEDWNFSKSTPKKDSRKVIKSMAEHNEFQRLAAIKLKKVYDVVLQHCR